MFKNIVKYIMAKIAFAKFRTEIFCALMHGDEYIKLFNNLAFTYKDMTPEDFQKEFINIKKELLMSLATVVHDSNPNNQKK